MNEQIRTEILIGKENINKINNTNILLVGIGGVGGITAELLVRSGINNLTIIDYDTFEESNLNRQILCTNYDLKKEKVLVAKKRLLSINPNCNIDIKNIKIDDDNIKLLSEKYDYIIDAIDDVNAKILLIKFAINNNIKIISSCGTGNRLDPSKLYITNIWKTAYDPLAKKLRYELRKEHINYKLPVVASSEIPMIKTNGYVGSMAMVPNAAGCLIASYIIKDIINN